MNSPDIAWLLISQAWQITLLAALVATVHGIAGRRRPHLCHGLWLIVLLKCVTPPLWHHDYSLFGQVPPFLRASEVTETARAPQITGAELAIGSNSSVFHVGSIDQLSVGHPIDADPEVAYRPLSGPSISSDAGILRILLSVLATGMLCYAGIVSVLFLRCLRRIRQHRTYAFDSDVRVLARKLSTQLKLRDVPRIIVSNVPYGPVVLGIFRPVIVLPACLLSPAGAVKAAVDCASGIAQPALRPESQIPQRLTPILTHELLHIRRGDLVTGAIQTFAQCLWWFHPVVWIVNRTMARNAERCCDEQVIAELGCSPSVYARSLLSVIETKQPLRAVPVFPGVRAVEITRQRMERIMSLKHGCRKRTSPGAWVVVAVTGFLTLPGVPSQVAKQPDSKDISPVRTRALSQEETIRATTDQQRSAVPKSAAHVLFGVGVNSDAGVAGQLVLDEKEFSQQVKLNEISAPSQRTWKSLDARTNADHLTLQDKAPHSGTVRIYDVKEFRNLTVAEMKILSDAWSPTGAMDRFRKLQGIELLKEGISQFVEPDSWNAAGTDMTTDQTRGSLIIRQTSDVHEQIVEFLACLTDVRTLKKMSVRVYPIADLVVPAPGIEVVDVTENAQSTQDPADLQVDSARIVELIRTTVLPDSWEGDARIVFDRNALGVVIRQTADGHRRIAELLTQVRRMQQLQVSVECQCLRIPRDRPFKWIAQHVTFHQMRNGHQWALLTAASTRTMRAAIASENLKVTAVPKITTFAGQTALVNLPNSPEAAGLSLKLSFHPDAKSRLIRVEHQVGLSARPRSEHTTESTIVSSGQTLLLKIPADPSDGDTVHDSFLVAMTAELIEEVEEKVLGVGEDDTATAYSNRRSD